MRTRSELVVKSRTQREKLQPIPATNLEKQNQRASHLIDLYLDNTKKKRSMQKSEERRLSLQKERENKELVTRNQKTNIGIKIANFVEQKMKSFANDAKVD